MHSNRSLETPQKLSACSAMESMRFWATPFSIVGNFLTFLMTGVKRQMRHQKGGNQHISGGRAHFYDDISITNRINCTNCFI